MDKQADERVKREADAERERQKERADEVEIASDDSFPASDPPSFTPVKGEKKGRIPRKP